MFLFTVIQLTHGLGVHSKEDKVWLYIQSHTCLCVKHNSTEGQQTKFYFMYILSWEPEQSELLYRCHYIVVENGKKWGWYLFQKR